MKKLLRVVAMLAAVALLLTGCNMPELEDLMEDVYSLIVLGTATSFEDMEYVRPDMEQFRQQLETCTSLAQGDTDVDDMMDAVYALYDSYYGFYTNYNLSNIHYCKNMTDIYWTEEYNWCLENSSEVDAGMDQLLYTLADSSLKEELESDQFFGDGFFDAYTGDSIWDETFTGLANAESTLLTEYYDLTAASAEAPYYSEEFFEGYGLQLEELFVELIRVRQEMAAYAGYESYPAFAYDFYFNRDYTPEQAGAYMEQIRQELVPLYSELDHSAWDALYAETTQEEMLAYTQECAAAIGGVAENAFELMEKANLYDITYSENKYDASFEVFLPSYYLPYVYVCPTGLARDKLTLTHEFGHFCNDYAAGGTIASVDVAEIFSQGLEYLSLFYCENTAELEKGKLADSLATFVEQSAYAAFEQQVYALEGDALTVDNVRNVYQQVLDGYGLSSRGRDHRDYVLVPHFFIVPMYVFSYVVSNDAAMQIYQAEQAEAGAGLALWEDNLSTMQPQFLGFVEEAGLKSPFVEGRAAQLRETFEEILG